jgi:hypothetical protein
MANLKNRTYLSWGKILLLTLIALPAVWTLFLYSIGASWRAQYHLGIRTLWTIRQTERVEVFRLDPEDFSNTKQHIGRYAVIGKGQDLTSTQISRLSSALLQAANTDEINTGKTCVIMPGVGFRLWQSNYSLGVPVCYECSILVVQGTKSRPLDFDSQRKELVKIAKELFPNDKEIQNLNESR